DHFEMYWFPYTDRLQTKTNNVVPVSDRPLSRLRGWLDDEFLSNTVFGVACRLGRRVPATAKTIARIEAVALSPRVYTAPPYELYFQAFEKVARDLDGRPHWGKLHGRTAEDLRPAYPRFDDFLAVRERLDPDRVFANAYTAQVLGS